MVAYYNEFDPFAASWLENLIDAGHIAPGVVDTRSIEDVSPDDLKGFTQCHFFAGIGVWSLALRRAGWADDRPIWTGSCPCQPFSAAGKGNGFADERHLWPAFHWLIGQCEPTVVVGEQVASKDGLHWLDLVQFDMEASGYAFGAADLCAAGFGAPHIRQRSFWVAYANGQDSRTGLCDNGAGRIRRDDASRRGGSNRLDHHARPQGYAGHDGGSLGQRQGAPRPVTAPGVFDGLGYSDSEPTGRNAGGPYGTEIGNGTLCCDRDGSRNAGGPLHGLADGPGSGRGEKHTDDGRCVEGNRSEGRAPGSVHGGGDRWPGPTNGHWQNVDWLGCRDGKWRPVEPGTFPLVNGASNRVGRLRGYGNAIVAPVAQGFIEAVMECLP